MKQELKQKAIKIKSKKQKIFNKKLNTHSNKNLQKVQIMH